MTTRKGTRGTVRAYLLGLPRAGHKARRTWTEEQRDTVARAHRLIRQPTTTVEQLQAAHRELVQTFGPARTARRALNP